MASRVKSSSADGPDRVQRGVDSVTGTQRRPQRGANAHWREHGADGLANILTPGHVDAVERDRKAVRVTSLGQRAIDLRR